MFYVCVVCSQHWSAEQDIWGADEDSVTIDNQVAEWDTQQIEMRCRILENNIRVMKGGMCLFLCSFALSYVPLRVFVLVFPPRWHLQCDGTSFPASVFGVESSRLMHEVKGANDRIKENNEKIKMNKQLPYLVSNVVEVRVLRRHLSSPALRYSPQCCFGTSPIPVSRYLSTDSEFGSNGP